MRRQLTVFVSTIVLLSGFSAPCFALTCNDFLSKTISTVKSAAAATAKTLSVPRLLNERSIGKKLGDRKVESLLEKNGTHLNLSHLGFSGPDLDYILLVLKERGLITNKLTSVEIAYNPDLRALDAVPFFRELSHYTTLLALDMRGIYVSTKALDTITNYHNNIEKLRMSVFNGRSLHTLLNNDTITDKHKLTLLDISEAYIRKSVAAVPKDEELKRPSVSIGDLKQFIRNHQHTLKTIILPPYSIPQNEGIFELAKDLGIRLHQTQLPYMVTFEGEQFFNNHGGLRLKVNGKDTELYFASLIAPKTDTKIAEVQETVVAYHIHMFLKALAKEGVHGQLVSVIKTKEGTYMGDVYYTRVVNGQRKGYLLSQVLNYLHLLAPATQSWNSHFVTDSKVWERLMKLHDANHDRDEGDYLLKAGAIM